MNKGFYFSWLVFFLFEISADYIVKFSLTLTAKREKIVKSLLIHLGISFGLSLIWALLMRFINWMLKTFLGTLVMFIVGCVILFALFMITLGQLGYSNRHS